MATIITYLEDLVIELISSILYSIWSAFLAEVKAVAHASVDASNVVSYDAVPLSDEERPECQRCKKAGYKCQGYDRERIFLNQTSSTPPSGPSRSISDDLPVAMTVTSQPSTGSQNQAIVPPRELDLTPFYDNLLFSCFFQNYVHGNFCTPWLNMATDGQLGVTAFEASRALAAEFFSLHHQDPSYRTKAATHYGYALKLLQTDVAAVGDTNPEILTIPIMILISYDFLTYSEGVNWDHHDGLFNVVQSCEPQSFQREPYHSAFETSREMLIARAIQERRRIFLERPEWKTVPWALNPAQKSPTNFLLDQLANIPGLLEDESRLDSFADPSETKGFCLRTMAHLDLLYDWRWTFNTHNNGSVVEQVVPKHEFDGIEDWAPTCARTRLLWTSHLVVNELALYNAIQLFLLRMMLESGADNSGAEIDAFFASVAFRRQVQIQARVTSLQLPGEANSLLQITVEICRLFECQQQAFNAQNKDCLLAWLMPMGLAYQVLQRCGADDEEQRIKRWAASTLTAMPGSFQHACLYIAKWIRLFQDGEGVTISEVVAWTE